MLILIFHDNEDWLPPLVTSIEKKDMSVFTIDIDDYSKKNESVVDAIKNCKAIINRVSPSFVKRGRTDCYSKFIDFSDLVKSLRPELEILGGGLENVRTEFSKGEQLRLCKRHGVKTPASEVATEPQQLVGFLQNHESVFIKPNCGGSGYGVSAVTTKTPLNDLVLTFESACGKSFDDSVLLQKRVNSEDVYRAEFIDGVLVYVLRINQDTSSGFNNCPADICELSTSQKSHKVARDTPDQCQIFSNLTSRFTVLFGEKIPREITKEFDAIYSLIDDLKSFTCGIEFMITSEGNAVVIDINCVNTNYNRAAEKRARLDESAYDSLANAVFARAIYVA